jgi:hypothetical protein
MLIAPGRLAYFRSYFPLRPRPLSSSYVGATRSADFHSVFHLLVAIVLHFI